MNFNIKHQQLGTQCDSNVNSQIPDFTPIGDLIFSPNRQNIKCITSMTEEAGEQGAGSKGEELNYSPAKGTIREDLSMEKKKHLC